MSPMSKAVGPPVNGELHVDLDQEDFLAVFPLGGQGRARLIGTVRDERADRADTGTPLRPRRPVQATGREKRGDDQIYRARVLEVRIHSPPAESRMNFRFLSGGAPFGVRPRYWASC